MPLKNVYNTLIRIRWYVVRQYNFYSQMEKVPKSNFFLSTTRVQPNKMGGVRTIRFFGFCNLDVVSVAHMDVFTASRETNSSHPGPVSQ